MVNAKRGDDRNMLFDISLFGGGGGLERVLFGSLLIWWWVFL